MTTVLRALLIGGLLVAAGMLLDRRLQSPQHELRARDARIAELDRTLEAREQDLDALRGEVSSRNARIDELMREVGARDRLIAELETAARLMRVDHRIARLEVLEQTTDADDPSRVRTRVRFAELGEDGRELGTPRVATIEGRTAYVEALVVKFGDAHVAAGDAWRGTSICLFTRLFGDRQRPQDGTPIDAVGVRPTAYDGGDDELPFEADLWTRFWDYAHDPQAAAAAGVRAIHGEAPFVELRPGRSYRVELRASGGLTIVPE